MRAALIPLLLLAAQGCQRGPRVDTSLRAADQDSRAQYLILHFTGGTWEESVKILTSGGVSAHYLVRDEPVSIHALVPEERRAWHAGESYWRGHTALNAASIGIEIQNRGDVPGPDGKLRFHPYPEAQIEATLALVKDIVARHRIRPDRILGHAEIAPSRKVDPGPTFPWKRLADAGLITWPDPAEVARRRQAFAAAPPDLAWFQERLAAHGYNPPRTGALDRATREMLASVQMKYRPERWDGEPDAETAAILDVLVSPGRLAGAQ